MSLPKKGIRKIVVLDTKYSWKAKDNGDHKSLTIQKEDHGLLLFCNISSWSCGDSWEEPLTPSLVRVVIEKGLNDGWQPLQSKSQPFRLDISGELVARSKIITSSL